MAPGAKDRSLLGDTQEPLLVEEEPGVALNGGVQKRGGEDTQLQQQQQQPEEVEEEEDTKQPIKWTNVVFLSVIHLWWLYSISYLPYMKWQSWIWIPVSYTWAGYGVTGGAHRLWTHRSYKASLPLRIVLMLAFGSVGMNSIYDWVRDHRVHHKFSETDADPHNAKRGFFFSHVGWLLMKKHPEVVRRGKQVNMDDIEKDPVCMFDKKYHKHLVYVMCFILPTLVPVMCWDESWSCAWAGTMLRWVIGLNAIWSVNSVAHLVGGKPFNKFIFPANNAVVACWAMGEGWHNYHHVFPWDYKTSETGFLNTTMHLIRLSCALGLASDLKTASPDLIKRVVQRYGDGTHPDWTESAPEVPEEAADDISVVDTLPPPNFKKHD